MPSQSAADRFPPTRLSVLLRARGDDEAARSEAFGLLVAAYWRPIYTYLRLRWRLEAADAEDQTQSFLATAWEQGFLAADDAARARFRTFLRVCLDRHVQNQQKAALTLKRGGRQQLLSLDFVSAEDGLRGREAADPSGTEELFQREFVRELFSHAVTQLRAELEGRGRGVVFAVFDRYDLGPADGVRYADVARELGIPVSHVTNHLHAARRRFRELVLDRLRELSSTEAEFRAEARELLGLDPVMSTLPDAAMSREQA